MSKESNFEAPTIKPKAQTWAEYGVTALFVILFCGPVFLEALSRPLRWESYTQIVADKQPENIKETHDGIAYIGQPIVFSYAMAGSMI